MDNRVEPVTRLVDGADGTAAPESDADDRKADVAKPGPAGRTGSNGDRADHPVESASASTGNASVFGTAKPAPVDSDEASPVAPKSSPNGNGADDARASRPSTSPASGPLSSRLADMPPRPATPAAAKPADPPSWRSAGVTAQMPVPANPQPASPVPGTPGSSAAPGLAPSVAPTAAQVSGRLSPPRPGPGYPASVPSDGAKSKIKAPFGTLTKKKPKPSKTGRPGSPIDTGKAGTVQKTGPQRRPAAQLTPKGISRDGVQARDAQLVVSRIEPWSVMKFSFLVSLVGWVVLFIAVAVIYFLFSSLGVFHQIEQTIGLVTSSKGSIGSNAASWFSASTILGYTMLAGAVDVVLITALATVGTVIYNLVTHLSGGIEVTLREAD